MFRTLQPAHNPWPGHDRVIVFDGVCNFCNAFVDFVIRHDPECRFVFVPLQSESAQRLLEALGLDTHNFETFLYVENGHAFMKSTAALKIVRALKGSWSWLAILTIVPRMVRDAIYDWVVKHRYRLMGKRQSCRAPSLDERHRFLR